MGTDSSNHKPVFSMLQDSPVARQFKALGYRYLHIGSWFGETSTDSAADRSLYSGARRTSRRPCTTRARCRACCERLHFAAAKLEVRTRLRERQFGWKALSSVRDAPGPKLVIAHFLLPHPPYVFDRDGNFVDPRKDPSVSEHDRLAGQLHGPTSS